MAGITHPAPAEVLPDMFRFLAAASIAVLTAFPAGGTSAAAGVPVRPVAVVLATTTTAAATVTTSTTTTTTPASKPVPASPPTVTAVPPTHNGQPCTGCETRDDAVECIVSGARVATGRLEAAKLGVDCSPVASPAQPATPLPVQPATASVVTPSYNGQPCTQCETRADAVRCTGSDGFSFETGAVEAARLGLACAPAND